MSARSRAWNWSITEATEWVSGGGVKGVSPRRTAIVGGAYPAVVFLNIQR